MWQELSLKERMQLIHQWRKEHVIDYESKKREYDASEARKLEEGGSTNPMNYEYRGTIHSDELKNQGITHVAELPEVVVTGNLGGDKYKTPSVTPYLTMEQARSRHRNIASHYLNATPSIDNLYYAGINFLKGVGVLMPEGTGYITGEVPLPSKTALSPAMLSKGWTIAKDGARVSPTGQRFILNSKGILQSESSLGLSAAMEARKATKAAQTKRAQEATRSTLSELKSLGFSRFKPREWFQGRGWMNNTPGAVTKGDVDIYNSHLSEYLDLAKQMRESGALRQNAKGQWIGRFSDGERIVVPEEYIVAHSKAFQNAGLRYDAVNRMSAMTGDTYRKFINNGGLGITTWTTDNLGQGNVFLGERNADGLGKLVGSLVSKKAPVKYVPTKYAKEAREVYQGLEASSNVPYKGTVGNYTLFGHNMQMKTLRGNNGDFNMGNFNPFRVLAPLGVGTAAYGYFSTDE